MAAAPTGLSLKKTVTVPPQLSVYTGICIAAPHATVTFGAQVPVGAVRSTTLIVCVQLAVLPQPSVTVHVRFTNVKQFWFVRSSVNDSTGVH